MAFDIKAWSDYGVAIVGGAAAPAGLLFVAVSVNSAWFSSSEAHRGRAGQALVLFVVPLATGILLLIPGQTTTALGIEIAAFGLLVGRVLLMLGSAELTAPAGLREPSAGAELVGHGRLGEWIRHGWRARRRTSRRIRGRGS
jgi:hypothetical protein